MATPATRAAARPARGRNLELLLIAAAVAVSGFALALAGWQVEGRPPDRLVLYTGVLGALALAAHAALRTLAPWADPLLLPLATVLNGIGLTAIWALHTANGTGPGEADRQLLFTAVGAAALVGVLALVRRPLWLRRYPYLTAAAGLALILSPVLPFVGIEVFGARRWLGFAGYTVQPSEFARVLLIVFLAGYLGRNREVLALTASQVRLGPVKVFSLPRMRVLGPMTSAWAAAILILVATRDLGTSLVLFSVFLAMLYAATGRKSWVGIGLAMFLAGAWVAWLVFWHVRQRVTIWIDPFDPEVYREVGGSRQLVEGLFALADGGLLGIGFGTGRAAGIFAADSDLVLVSIGEAYGLVGLAAVVLLLAMLTQRGFAAALAARDPIARLTAAGCAFLLAFQTFVVLGGVTRLIPLTGMTTPFLSAGGSSLVSTWMIVALWLRVSDSARRPGTAPAPGAAGADTGAVPLLSSSSRATGRE
ncbi:FtsW/RodA/SpoVE family cell cycle protein [Streptomonospora sp. S1-112]|uniref:peptidoglycan glycosyltransferase n=1 Tax=Streptomonospora mangrovi TaxID=2883123 RepID=A0A9X3SET5_9ACTN|nr:FtsW/RodA/SpoVE family cell cycle protein [Streptomonospora mangrovi]MDA0566218.1 FtsW/RodA/SpoVE family cell cycle protein [Streptomonospora mangrovi]